MNLCGLTIISRNGYLKKGFDELIDVSALMHDICVVDIDSFNSLREISLMISYIDDASKVIFTGSSRVYFPLLQKFTWMDEQVLKNTMVMSTSLDNSKNIGMLKEHLMSCRALHQLSSEEIQICSLCCLFNIRFTASRMHKNLKTIYKVINFAMRKMNFKSMTHLGFFY